MAIDQLHSLRRSRIASVSSLVVTSVRFVSIPARAASLIARVFPHSLTSTTCSVVPSPESFTVRTLIDLMHRCIASGIARSSLIVNVRRPFAISSKSCGSRQLKSLWIQKQSAGKKSRRTPHR